MSNFIYLARVPCVWHIAYGVERLLAVLFFERSPYTVHEAHQSHDSY